MADQPPELIVADAAAWHQWLDEHHQQQAKGVTLVLAMFAILTSQNRYAVLYRIASAKQATTRVQLIKQFVAMLARGETFHAQKRTLDD